MWLFVHALTPLISVRESGPRCFHWRRYTYMLNLIIPDKIICIRHKTGSYIGLPVTHDEIFLMTTWFRVRHASYACGFVIRSLPRSVWSYFCMYQERRSAYVIICIEDLYHKCVKVIQPTRFLISILRRCRQRFISQVLNTSYRWCVKSCKYCCYSILLLYT